MKKTFILLLSLFVLFSCKENRSKATKEKNNAEQVVSKENLKSITTTIDGMTCEIGCAKTIESRLSKMEGVTFSKVNFETKEGKFTYDASKISEEDIKNKINGIAGGDMYKVTDLKKSEEIF